MPRNKNLLAALGAEKGRDVAAEKRKKQAKAAERRKREKAEQNAQEASLDGDTEIEGSKRLNGISSGESVCSIQTYEGPISQTFSG